MFMAPPPKTEPYSGHFFLNLAHRTRGKEPRQHYCLPRAGRSGLRNGTTHKRSAPIPTDRPRRRCFRWLSQRPTVQTRTRCHRYIIIPRSRGPAYTPLGRVYVTCIFFHRRKRTFSSLVCSCVHALGRKRRNAADNTRRHHLFSCQNTKKTVSAVGTRRYPVSPGETTSAVLRTHFGSHRKTLNYAKPFSVIRRRPVRGFWNTATAEGRWYLVVPIISIAATISSAVVNRRVPQIYMDLDRSSVFTRPGAFSCACRSEEGRGREQKLTYIFYLFFLFSFFYCLFQ